MNKFLICGLGNIGSQYENTRHNIGFKTLDALAQKLSLEFKLEKHALFTEGKIKGKPIYLIKPTTYMNLSGKALRYYVQLLKIDLKNVLVVTDDIHIEFGRLKLKSKGSSGGHNGLQNILELLNTSDWPRLRVGVGNNFRQGKQVDYVLGNWTDDENRYLPEIIDVVSNACLDFCTKPIGNVMNEVNGFRIE